MALRRKSRRGVVGLVLLVAVGSTSGGCSQGEAGESGASAPRGQGTAAPPGPQEAAVPAAILGEAPPPRGEDVRYVPGDENTIGYVVAPGGQGPYPSVLLIHEWNGLVDRIRQVADAFADEGYVALAADLYRGRVGSNRDENMALVRETQADPDAIIANLDAAVRYLRAREDVTGKVAAMGWCFGGGVALSYALGGESHEGTAIFYGRLVDDPERLATIDHPIYGTFAELDRGIPPEQVARFAAALEAAGVENDIHVYDEVDHGFWLYVEQDTENALGPAADAWRRLKAYLASVLG